MNKQDLAKIHRIDTEILKNVAEICDRHRIEYFVMYGTLIGAVRHGGPIPWDDDVDIGMTRENYMRFLEVAENEIDPRNQINIMGSGSVRYLSELKIGRKGTWFYLDGTRNLDIMRQIQLDVFLFDYIKPLSAAQKKLYIPLRKILDLSKLSWGEKRLIMMVQEESKRKSALLYKLGLTMLHGVRLVLGEERVEKIIYKLFVDETGTSGQMGLVYEGGKLHTWPAEYFHDLTKMEYDGLSVSAPAHYDQILTDVYGDYMQIPPEDKQYRRFFDRFVVEVNE